MKTSKLITLLFSVFIIAFGMTFAGCSQKSDEEKAAEEVAGHADDAAAKAEEVAKAAEKEAEKLKKDAEKALNH